jgi:hypothetical protein
MIDKKYLPSRKFLIALSMAVSIVLLTIIFNLGYQNNIKYMNNDLVTATDTVATAFSNIDSDKDGLPDWKEALYGTNPLKADTDGDGTSDFDEIAQNRDPLKPNTASKGQEPNDKIDPSIVEKNQTALKEYEKLNETDRLSRDIISNVIASQPRTGSMDPGIMNSIVSKAVGELPEKKYAGITKDTDLNLLKTDSKNLNKNMSDYATNFQSESLKLAQFIGTDMDLIGQYISSGSTSTKESVLRLADKYQTVVNDFIQMPVPVALGYYDVNYHLRVINDLEIIIAIDRDIANSDKDSLSIFSNMSIYGEIFHDLISNLKIITDILKI